jgi:YD repeat-containing protein
MISENRFINGISNPSQPADGAYKISYSYNLANQLQGVTDPFGAQIGYTRNTVGQTTSITGSGFAGVSSYVSNIQYRAWGAPKSATYGNDTSSTTTYNARMQPWQFRLTYNPLGSSIIREDYTYNGDGNLQWLTDLDDTAGSNPPATLRYLSRGLGYDNVGRVTGGVASSGLIPFTQNYGYDAFDNMTSRSGSYYNYTGQQTPTDTATYTNNRRNGWNYDADGRVTSNPASSTDDAHSLTYDAAGRMVTNVDYASYTTITYGSGYDGDGKLLFESSQFYSYSASYIVRSTVLGDVLTRLDQSGNKKITHVPAEGLLFATQETYSSPQVIWTQRNPPGITEKGKAIYDPLGNYIPFRQFSDPRPAPGSYSSYAQGGLSASQANPDGYAMGCLMDGLPTNCNLAMLLINNGSAARCPNNNCSPQFDPNREGRGQGGWRIPILNYDGSFSYKRLGPSSPQNPEQPRGQTSRRSTTTDECKTHRSLLLGRDKRALDDAWNRSQFGTSGAHEEGGLLGRALDYGQTYQKDLRVNTPYTPTGAGPRGVLTGFTNWAYAQIRADKDTVGYNYWYHTHPFEQGAHDPVTGDEYGDPNQASYNDADISVKLRLRGVLVTKTSVIVYDYSGSTICEFARGGR